jgi:hypothetical protein
LNSKTKMLPEYVYGRGKTVKKDTLSRKYVYGLLGFKQKVYSDWGSKGLLRLK